LASANSQIVGAISTVQTPAPADPQIVDTNLTVSPAPVTPARLTATRITGLGLETI